MAILLFFLQTKFGFSEVYAAYPSCSFAPRCLWNAVCASSLVWEAVMRTWSECPILYDTEWVFGYQGTVYAHIGSHRDAQNALYSGINDLGQAKVFRKWGFYKDLVITQSAEGHLEEACASAREMLTIAEQTQAPMELWRSSDTVCRHLLRRWPDQSLVKDIVEEFGLPKRF